MSPKKLATLLDLHEKNPSWGRHKLAKEVGVSENQVRHELLKAQIVADPPEKATPEEIAKSALKIIAKTPQTHSALVNALGCSLSDLEEALEIIGQDHTLDYQGSFISIGQAPRGFLPLRIIDSEAWTRIGVVADTHLCCREERLEALHAQYDLFAKEKITTVLHCGNIVDGYVPHINGGSVICPAMDDQAQYVVDNYPARPGIKTHYITGDDHEGWWMKEGFNFGAYLEMVALRQNRTDLHYIGHVEADVEFQLPNGKKTIVKVQHPGGGSSYARSYTGQKQVEAFQGGEKPAILLQGHYHVSNYMVERNIHVISMPGFEDQTIFARKKRLRMEVGGAILEFKVNPEDGAVTRCKLEFNMYFDRGYYRAFLRSDQKLVKGHLVLQSSK